MKGKRFFSKVFLTFLIVLSLNINVLAVNQGTGRDIRDVIGKDENGDDYNMLVDGDLKFIDENGDLVDKITKDAKASITFDFNVDADHLDMLRNGDYFEFDLPEFLKVLNANEW